MCKHLWPEDVLVMTLVSIRAMILDQKHQNLQNSHHVTQLHMDMSVVMTCDPSSGKVCMLLFNQTVETGNCCCVSFCVFPFVHHFHMGLQ